MLIYGNVKIKQQNVFFFLEIINSIIFHLIAFTFENQIHGVNADQTHTTLCI